MQEMFNKCTVGRNYYILYIVYSYYYYLVKPFEVKSARTYNLFDFFQSHFDLIALQTDLEMDSGENCPGHFDQEQHEQCCWNAAGATCPV